MRYSSSGQSLRLRERAQLIRIEAARLCARSAELVDRVNLTRQKVLRDFEKLAASWAERHERRRRPVARPWVSTIRPLPLTPRMLREVAAEFEGMADQAAASETRLAFCELAFRYRALAAGYDIENIRSRMLH
jgi:hypothetical protein